MLREAANVELVDHGLGERAPEGRVAFPVISARVGHDALHGDRSVLAGSARGHAVVRIRDGDHKAVGIEQQLFVIETKPSLRCEWSASAIRVDLFRLEARHERVPIVIGALRCRVERDDA